MLARAAASLSLLPPRGGRAMSKVPLALVKELRAMTGAPVVDCKNALADPAVAGDLAAAKDWLRARGVAAAASRAGKETSQGLVGLARAGDAAALAEVNCETDFVALNDGFQALVREAADAALADGDVDLPAALGDQVADLVAAVRESVTPRRAARLEGETLGVYVHNKVPGSDGQLGQAAAVVALAGAGGAGDPQAEEQARRLAMHVVAARPQFVSRDDVSADALDKEREVVRESLAAAIEGKPEHVVEKMVEGKLGKFFSETVLLEQAHMVEGGKDSVAKVLARELGKGVTVTGMAYFRVGE